MTAIHANLFLNHIPVVGLMFGLATVPSHYHEA